MDEPIRITTYKGSVRLDEVHPKWALVGSHTGHSDYRAMRPYIAVADQSRRDAMAAFDRLNGDDQV